MRSWTPTNAGDSNTVDIIVSELLGSFADNELSPECLDGVQHNLSTDHVSTQTSLPELMLSMNNYDNFALTDL